MIAAMLACMLASFGGAWDPSRDVHADPAVRMPSADAVRFDTAVPVWPAGRAGETNSFFGFRADYRADTGCSPVLKIAASTFYRVYVNGEFVGHGPVRSAHGSFRADEWPLGGVTRAGLNTVAVEVSVYRTTVMNCAGDQPGFLQCEVGGGGRVLCATGRDFTFFELPRVRNTSRFTTQRHFVEMYRIGPKWKNWRTDDGAKGGVPERCPDVEILPRISPYPKFDVVRPRGHALSRFGFDTERTADTDGLAYCGYDEMDRFTERELEETSASSASVSLGRGLVADFGRVNAGFPGFKVTCSEPCTVYAVFDEDLTDGLPDPARRWWHGTSAVWELTAPGTYEVELFEPTAVRYLHLFTRRGTAEVGDVYLREYKNPRVYAADFVSSDARLNRVFAAARETCALCTMDAALDNPGRERNSGPCDAFFTLGGYNLLSGDLSLERLFFDNYARLPPVDGAGSRVIPWCYPAAHPEGKELISTFLPWFAIQLGRYTEETGDTSFRDAFKERLLSWPGFFRSFSNSDGLHENLPGWMFIGWSMANAFTKGVNYPENALWAEGLDVLSRLYGRSDLSEEAARIRKAARERSFDGTWFRDHAVRDGTGELKVSDDMSETCQYYAFKFGLAHPGSDTNLWDRVVRRLGRCGPWQHRALGRMYPSNYFQGLMLRHMLLTDNKLHREAVRELGYLVDMADRTGTLWESYPGIGGGFCWLPGYSRCQGFTSYAAVLIVRSALGISSIDRRNRRVRFAVPDNGLRFCRGTLPTADGPIEVAWERSGGRIVREKVRLPPGWVRVNDADGPAADRSVARE